MSTNITELLYNFAMNFFIKAPTLFSSAYIHQPIFLLKQQTLNAANQS